MDSLTQLALGATVATAVAGRRAGFAAAVAGGVLGTLPDLDVLIDYSDPVARMIYHRGWSHSLFWLTLAALVLWPLLARMRWYRDLGWRLGLMIWLSLITHPLLDALTIYGTQLWRPFSAAPVGLGSVFIIDPVVTVPLLVSLWFCAARRWRSVRPAIAGLLAAAIYLATATVIQARLTIGVGDALPAASSGFETLALPTPFNIGRWRLLAKNDELLCEQYVYAFQQASTDAWQCRQRGQAYLRQLGQHWPVARLREFSKDWVVMDTIDNALVIRDVRMGIPEDYVFSFEVARRDRGQWHAVPARQLKTGQGGFSRWRRAYGMPAKD